MLHVCCTGVVKIAAAALSLTLNWNVQFIVYTPTTGYKEKEQRRASDTIIDHTTARVLQSLGSSGPLSVYRVLVFSSSLRLRRFVRLHWLGDAAIGYFWYRTNKPQCQSQPTMPIKLQVKPMAASRRGTSGAAKRTMERKW